MKITTRGAYGLRFLLDLAIHGGRASVSLHDISRRQGLSEKYLWQVIAPLRSAGIIRSQRGAQGGYRLAKPAAGISLRAVLEALEGEAEIPALPRTPAGRDRDAGVVARAALQALVRAWRTAADAVTLEALAEDHRRMKSHGALMYEI